MKSHRDDSGFTLIEMMVTVAVLVIILAVATPSFTIALQHARLKSQAMRIIDVIEFAKSEATKGLTTRNIDGTWNSNVRISVASGSNWTVVADSQGVDSNGNHITISRKATHEDASGITLESPSTASMTLNFRRLITGDVDTPIVLKSANGDQIKISVSAVGRITACAVGTSIGGFSSC